LQTVFLQNDSETLQLISSNREGWVNQVTEQLGIKPVRQTRKSVTPEMQKLSKKLQGLRRNQAAARKAKDKKKIQALAGQIRDLQSDLARAARNRPVSKTAGEKVADLDSTDIVKQAFLRTLSRFPDDRELARSRGYIEGAGDTSQGLRDLLWALLNTKEFIVNH